MLIFDILLLLTIKTYCDEKIFGIYLDALSAGLLLRERRAKKGCKMIHPTVLFLGVASGFCSFVVSDSTLFFGFRKWICSKSEFLGKLFGCGVCTGTWCSFLFEILYQPNIFNKIPLLDQLLTSFVMAFISALCWITLVLLIDKADK